MNHVGGLIFVTILESCPFCFLRVSPVIFFGDALSLRKKITTTCDVTSYYTAANNAIKTDIIFLFNFYLQLSDKITYSQRNSRIKNVNTRLNPKFKNKIAAVFFVDIQSMRVM